MASILDPVGELLTGKACKPHPRDGALPLGKRFAGQTIVVIGGFGSKGLWSQRVKFAGGQPQLVGERSLVMPRDSAEWGSHLSGEAQQTSGWAVLLVEQQWKAASALSSGASTGRNRVEQMLQVRERTSQFGGDIIERDAIRVAIDHPEMDTSIVVGIRESLLNQWTRETVEHGLQIAAIRVASVAYLEQYLATLLVEHRPLERSVVATDGQSALTVGVDNHAFDTTEGGVGYVVNRVADLGVRVLEKITNAEKKKTWAGKVDLFGPAELWALPGVDVRQNPAVEPAMIVVDNAVMHDFRLDLQETRSALPRFWQPAFFGALLLCVASIVGICWQVKSGLDLVSRIGAVSAETQSHEEAKLTARAAIDSLLKEEKSARQLGTWVENNYHAQALVHAFLQMIPANVSLDSFEITATEGSPQLKLKFGMAGTEDALAVTTRAIEARLYEMKYEIAQRDDPIAATQRRGGVIYSWVLITPTFGS